MKRSKVVIFTKSIYDVISSIDISKEQFQEIDSIIKEEYKKESNIKEHLDIISFKIAYIFEKTGYLGNLYVRTQKILTGLESVKLLITITDNRHNPIFEL